MFEHCGILHEQIPGQLCCTQDHSIKQLRLIPMEHAGAMNDEVSEPVKPSFWSLLGGAGGYSLGHCCVHWFLTATPTSTDLEAHQEHEHFGILDGTKI